jgi:hypothetical protein
VCDFAASRASAQSLSTRKTTISDGKCKLPALNHLLKHKRITENYGKKPWILHAEWQ